MDTEEECDSLHEELPELAPDHLVALQRQESRPVTSVRYAQALREARKHWDLFYKRNGDRFFKCRHWILREFPELREVKGGLLEAGCGTGALLFPVADELPHLSPLLACDLSPRAVDLVRQHPDYKPPRFLAFQSDLCSREGRETVVREVGPGVGAVTAVFLLSALPPDLQPACAQTLAAALRPGGMLLLRDYARYDMAQLRFGPGHLITDNLYLRQDNTMSYFFTIEEMRTLLEGVGLREVRIGYVQRRTTNLKEGLDVPRTFLQACFVKPSST